ncbi:MAG: DUF3596 domain-containing protein [Thermodesulfobacteriota bacterium]
MVGNEVLVASIIPFRKSQQEKGKYRKYGLNRNKEGSVRKINGKVYVDFLYLGERVRESSDLEWNESNARSVREQLDKIIVSIKSGTFRFSEVFPKSKSQFNHLSFRAFNKRGSLKHDGFNSILLTLGKEHQTR